MIKKLLLVVITVLMISTVIIGCSMDNGEMSVDIEQGKQEQISEKVNEGQTGFEDLDVYLEQQFQKLEVAGMAIAIVEGEETVFFNGYGKMNKEKNMRIDEDTIFLMASITKTITGCAVMQLVEQGMIDLDQDINEYLPYEVLNPVYPNKPITTRMLLCHTSSIIDNWDVLDQLYTYDQGGGDPTISLAELCQEYFDENGKWYDDYNNYIDEVPGEYYEYSNAGYALLGNIVETITGQEFYVYCNENIFEPLGMENSSLFLKDLDIEKIAIPYSYGEALPHYSFADYPDGSLRTSCKDFAKFVSMAMNKGTYKGVQILKEETFEDMLTEQYTDVTENQGLTWDLKITEAYNVSCDELMIGHNGGESGADTLMFFNPNSKKGIMILINDEITKKHMSDYDEIVERLVEITS